MGTPLRRQLNVYKVFSEAPAVVFVVKLQFVSRQDGGKLWALLTWPRMAISGGLFEERSGSRKG
jgi:hypothetical protein